MSDRYAIERVKDRRWVVIDTARQGPPIGGSASETGARDIVALLGRMRPATSATTPGCPRIREPA